MTARVGLVGWKESVLLPALLKILRALLGEERVVCALKHHPRIVPDRPRLAVCSCVIDVMQETECVDRRLTDSILAWRAPVPHPVLVPVMHLLTADSMEPASEALAGWSEGSRLHKFAGFPLLLDETIRWTCKIDRSTLVQEDWTSFLHDNLGEDARILLAKLLAALDDLAADGSRTTEGLKVFADIREALRAKRKSGTIELPHSLKYVVPRLLSEMGELSGKGNTHGGSRLVGSPLFEWARGILREYLGDLAAYGRI